MENGNKIAGKSERNWGMMVMMMGSILRVQGPVPNMVIYPKIARKYSKNWKALEDVSDDSG